MNCTFYGKIENGKLVLENRPVFTEFVASQKDQRIEVVIRSPKKTPTQRQWAFLYGSVYRLFGDSFGWELDAVDYYFKEKFMRENLIMLPKGMQLSKASFDREWLSKYVDACIRYCAEQGVHVPPPTNFENT